MSVREITKALAGQEDILFGQSTTNQTRNGTTYPITRIDKIHPVATRAALKLLDVSNADLYFNTVLLLGLHSIGAGGGIFCHSSTLPKSMADDVDIIVDSNVGNGCWVRIIPNSVSGMALNYTEVGAWLAETTAGSATGAGASLDLSATGIDLDATGTLTKSAVNTGAGLMAFSGWSVSNYLSRVYGADLDITDQITIMVWINATSAVGQQQIAGNMKNGAADYGGYCLRLGGLGDLKFQISNNIGTVVEATDPAGAIELNKWIFVVCTMTTAGLISLYKNGLLIDTTAGGVIDATTSPFKVGLGYNNSSGSLDYAFSGSIAGVRVINGVLTAAQIVEIYQREKAQFLYIV